MKLFDKKHLRKTFLRIFLPLFFVVFLILATTNLMYAFNLEMSDTISIALASIESFGLVVSLVFAGVQLHESKQIAKADFIAELNKSFVENSDYMLLYNYLQAIEDRDDKTLEDEERRLAAKFVAENENEITKSRISNYLTFFETIYLLKEQGAIDLRTIDDLFAYRFFMAVHSEIFQKKKICKQPENFKNIYLLENDWLIWRYQHGKSYEKEAKRVYDKNLLMDKTEEERYRKIVGEKAFKRLISFVNPTGE